MAREKQHTPCLSEHREPGRGTFSFVFFLGGGVKKLFACLVPHACCDPSSGAQLPLSACPGPPLGTQDEQLSGEGEPRAWQGNAGEDRIRNCRTHGHLLQLFSLRSISAENSGLSVSPRMAQSASCSLPPCAVV